MKKIVSQKYGSKLPTQSGGKPPHSKLSVAPPESHKEPTFPTLAALGVFAAASALSGCEKRTGGSIIAPGLLAPIENGCETAPPLDGDVEFIPLPGEMPAVQIPQEEKETELPMRGRIRGVTPPPEEKKR